jgi:micrococcal nuclease
MKKLRSYSWIIFLVLLLFTSLRVFRINSHEYQKNSAISVKHIIDGDTIVVEYEGRTEKIRLIGINTPEIHHPTKGIEPYGYEAKRFVEGLLKPGDSVKLEFDIQLRDKYGRLLAYVYLPDGRFLNALLVENGYAQVMTIPPNVKYQELFLKLQREARENNLGLWAGKKLITQTPAMESSECNFISSKVGSVFHKPDCEWAKKIKSWNKQCFSTNEDAIRAGKRPCRVCMP